MQSPHTPLRLYLLHSWPGKKNAEREAKQASRNQGGKVYGRRRRIRAMRLDADIRELAETAYSDVLRAGVTEGSRPHAGGRQPEHEQGELGG